MKKILSITIPVYNTEKYLRRCLDSILLEDILNKIEVILVNDGSKDNSLEILKEYQRKFPESIIVVDKENGGHGSTINKGLEIASGKYFKVIDSDDWVSSFGFETFVNDLERLNVDLVVTNYRKEHVYNGNSEFSKYAKLKANKIYYFDDFDLKILKGEYFVMATSTYRTEMLKDNQIRLFEKTFYVDMQYNIQAIEHVDSFVYLDLDIYRYFIGRKEQSMNMNNFVKNKEHHDKVIRKLIDYYVENKESYSKNRNEYIQMILVYMLYTHYSIYCIYDKDKRNARKEIISFNNYLKSKSPELFAQMYQYELIRLYRKFNFLFVYFNKTFLEYIRLYRRIPLLISKLKVK